MKKFFAAVKKAFSVKNALWMCLILLVVCVLAGGYCNWRNIARLRVDVTTLTGRTDAVEQKVATLTGRADAADKKFVALAIKDGVIDKAIKTAQGCFESLKSVTTEMASRIDLQGASVASIEKGLGEVKGQAEKAMKIAVSVSRREDARVKMDNQKYKNMVAYIRGANPEAAIASMSDVEIEKQLNDGKWNLEIEIEKKYLELTGSKLSIAETVAKSAVERAESTEKKVEKAQAAGDAAIGGLEVIASQPNKLIGKSLSSQAKKDVHTVLTEYWKQYEANKVK